MLLRNQHQKYYPKCRHPPIMNVEVWRKFQFGRESLKLAAVTLICLQLWYQQTAVSVSFSSYSSYTATVAREADEVYDVVTSHQPIPEILGVL